VAAAANCLGPVTLAAAGDQATPVLDRQSLVWFIGAPSVSNGIFKLSLPTMPGESYVVQYKNSLDDPAWTDLGTVVGTGGLLSITDESSIGQPARFYRVIHAP
jgi:hypothetical protein